VFLAVLGTLEEWRVRMQVPVETSLFRVFERLAKSLGDGKFDADRSLNRCEHSFA
jgi:hypothetical protein